MVKLKVTIAMVGLSVSLSFGQQSDFCQPFSTVNEILNKYHYAPPAFTEKVSEEIFLDFLEVLDPAGLYFTEEDLQALQVFRNTLADASQQCVFVETTAGIYRKRLVETKEYALGILKSGPDWKIRDSLTFNRNDTSRVRFAADVDQLHNRWRKKIKYLIIQDRYNRDTAETEEEANMESSVERLSDFIVSEFDVWLDLNNPDYLEAVQSYFLNTLANRYDPHSMYFSPLEKSEFEQSNAPDVLSFGISVILNDKGEIEIQHIVPGSPAWSSNAMNQGDVLISAENDSGERIDFERISLRKARELLTSEKFERTTFTVKKTNGKTVDVELFKGLVRSDENIIRSFVLKGERKVGYIYLPGFYSNPYDYYLPGCANDVAKEIIKLKKENIEGLIIDLRYNGGGSIKEAVQLVGIFIDAGPVCYMEPRDEEAYSIKDQNRGSIYTGPLALMINGSSASASEIVAAGLRDYNRAVIVGSNSFGKATGQVVVPANPSFDMLNYDPSEQSDKGYVKITTDKLFRLDLTSAQGVGVVPDIVLPAPYQPLDPHESDYPYYLPGGSIVKKQYFKPLPPLPVNTLRGQSELRLGKSEYYRKIQAYNRLLDSLYNVPFRFALTQTGYADYLDPFERLMTEMDSLSDTSAGLSVVSTSYDSDVLQMDRYMREMTEANIEKVSDDADIGETVNILIDLINFKEK